MGNEVQVTGGRALAQYADDPWVVYAQSQPGGGGVQYAKFDGSTGKFSYGADRTEIELGTEVAVNMLDYKKGFICWVDNEVVDEQMVSVNEVLHGMARPITEADLKDHGPYKTYPDGTSDGWTAQETVGMKLFDGTDIVFKTSSGSGLRAMAALLKSYGEGRRIHGPDAIPIVKVDSTAFIPKKNPRAGTKYAPKFVIVDWKTQEELEELVADNAPEADEPEPAPAPVEEAKPAAARRGTRRF